MGNKEDPEQKYLNSYWSDRIQERLYVRLFLRHVVEKLEAVYDVEIDFEAIDKEVEILKKQIFEELEPQLIDLQNNAALFSQVEDILRGKNL